MVMVYVSHPIAFKQNYQKRTGAVGSVARVTFDQMFICNHRCIFRAIRTTYSTLLLTIAGFRSGFSFGQNCVKFHQKCGREQVQSDNYFFSNRSFPLTCVCGQQA